MKYYLIAGEASGDMHAAKLMEKIKQLDERAVFRYWGGDLMQEVAGNPPVKHYRDLAFMGFAEVIANLGEIMKNIKMCKKDISSFAPDIVIFIDYPGFNLRIAEFAHNQGFKTAYYISPQIWAWKESRIKTIKRNIDKMLVILPFEEKFYKKHNFKVDFVGHPLLEELGENPRKKEETKTIALAPGSRKQEVEKMLPVMLEAVRNFKDYKAVVAASKNLPEELYKHIIGDRKVELKFNDMRNILAKSDAALVTSGTATLETALLEIPQVVCYKAGRISYLIAKNLIKVKYISLVNLIPDAPIVKELIQNDLTVENIRKELKEILPGGSKHQTLLENYQKLPALLGGKGASRRAAEIIVKSITEKK